MAAVQYVFVMQNLTKVFPGGKELFKGITLSFLPGAKIGVLGVNGAGKSTLLKIMAGVDKEFNGEAWAADGVKGGDLEQEPQLDPKKNVMENIMDGLGETRDLLKRFEEVSMRFGEEMTDDEMNDLINEQAELQEKIDDMASQIRNMKDYLPKIVQKVGYRSVQEFLKDFKVSKIEYNQYRTALEKWKKETGKEPVAHGIRAKLAEKKQEIQNEQKNKHHTRSQNKDRGAR